MIGAQFGSYRIDQKLGEGGMGVVYRATEINLDRTVAIKVLNADLADKPAIVERFRSEAKAQANLNHTNIATLYAFLLDHGNAMIVMEYVDGENLQQLVNRRGAIPADEAIPLFKQALAGIGAAHEMGIVHRDIKPANIMVNHRGVVKVMDFGIAKVMGERGLTRTGVQLGTVFYMSPEQVRGHNADARSDIYALGVTLYEMLTAHVPFSGASEFDVLTDHVNTAPPLPSSHNANIPKGIESVVLKALEKRPEDRFQSVAEFADALDHSEDWEGYVPKSVMFETSSAVTEEIQTFPSGRVSPPVMRRDSKITVPPPPPPPAPPPGKSYLKLGLAALAAVAIVGAGTYIWLTKTPPPAPAATQMVQIPVAPPPLEPLPPSATEQTPPPVAKEEPKQEAKKIEPVEIPAKTEVRVQLTSAIEASAGNENELFPVALAAPIVVDGKTVAPAATEAHVVLTKAGGSKKSPKVQFQLSNIKIDGKMYKLRSDTYEFNNSTKGKKAGKLAGIGAVFGGLGGKHTDASIELPADTEMVFSLKQAVNVR